MKRMRPRGFAWLYAVADVTAIAAAYSTAVALRFWSDSGMSLFGFAAKALGVQEAADLGAWMGVFYVESAPRIITILAATICLLYAYMELYDEARYMFPRHIAWKVLVANAVALVLFYTYFYVRRNLWHPRSMFLAVAVLNVIYCMTLRTVLRIGLGRMRLSGKAGTCRAVLAGAGDDAAAVERRIVEAPWLGIKIVERIDASKMSEDGLDRHISEAVTRTGAEMILCADRALPISVLMRIMEVAEELDVRLKALSADFEVLVNQAGLSTDMLHGLPFVHFPAPSESGTWQWVKRGLSVGTSAILLVLLLPIFVAIAVFVGLTSRGSVFFVQERIGFNRKPFRMYKFRTMHNRADREQDQIEVQNEAGAGLFKIKQDPRITLAGRLLRRFSLDELPQLVNILKGDMTLVGPRPLPWRDFKNYYEEWHYSRHGGLPGLTCLWQVSGRSELDFHSMCLLDIYYLRNQGALLDLKILLRTGWAVLFARGAY